MSNGENYYKATHIHIKYTINDNFSKYLVDKLLNLKLIIDDHTRCIQL